MQLLKLSIGITLSLVVSNLSPVSGQDLMSGEFWKHQVMEDIIEPWTKHARDQEYGAFHTYLSKDWEKDDRSEKYPGMIARHLFSYSAAYLLSGEEQNMQLAHETFDFMVKAGKRLTERMAASSFQQKPVMIWWSGCKKKI